MKGLYQERTPNARNHGAGLDVPPGRVLAVVGPSGVGKSALLDLLCKLLKLDHGRLDVDSQVLVDSRRFVPAHRRRVDLLGQQSLLFPYLDVLSSVACGPRARGLRHNNAKALALEVLDRVDAAALASYEPGELLDDQAVRTALARALAIKPRTMLINEPFAAIDVEYTPRLWVAVKTVLAEIKCPCIIVTHDPTDVTALADDVTVLDNGRIVEHGLVAEVVAHPEDFFEELLLAQK